ncbi:MAG: AIR synthase-related protein [bacterium]
MYRVFNMGVGYTIIVRPKSAERVMKILRKLGEQPFPIGVIAKGKGDAQVVI